MGRLNHSAFGTEPARMDAVQRVAGDEGGRRPCCPSPKSPADEKGRRTKGVSSVGIEASCWDRSRHTDL